MVVSCLGLVLFGGFFLVVGVFLLWLLCVWGLFVWLLFCCSLLVGCWMAVLFVCLIVGLFVVCLFACLVLPSVREPPRTGGSPVAQIPILRSIRRRTTHTHNITRLHPLRIYHITRLHPLHPLRLYKHTTNNTHFTSYSLHMDKTDLCNTLKRSRRLSRPRSRLNQPTNQATKAAWA